MISWGLGGTVCADQLRDPVHALLLAPPQPGLGARETDMGWEGSLDSGQTTPLARQWERIGSQASTSRWVLGEAEGLRSQVSHPGPAPQYTPSI